MPADVLSYLRRLLPSGDSQRTDGELLRRYATTGAEGEFTELLCRHGPLVWAVCRRVLGDVHAAEDAFQATFLQLSRRAGSLRREGSLAGWLHTVATRLAHRALLAEKRRRRRERAQALSTPTSADDLTWRELRQMLDTEIARLAEAYRQPLILCYLENRPQSEAARRLGIPLSVLRGRLERGRQKLRQRLEKLGLPLAATLLLVKTEPAPAALMIATSQMVQDALTGGPVPPAVAALAMGGSLLSRSKIGVFAAILLIAGGIGIVGASRHAEPKEKPKDDPATATVARHDLYGDPLPAGALARLGTVRQRAPDSHLAITADGKEIVAVGSDMTVRRFDARTGALRSLRQLPAASVSSLHVWLSPRGTFALLADYKTRGFYHLDLWNLESSKIQQTLLLPRQTPWGAAFSGDEQRVAIGDTEDGQIQRILVWDLKTSQSRTLWSETKAYNIRYFEPFVTFSPDGKRLLSCHLDQILRCWDAESGKLLWKSDKKCYRPFFFFSPDGKTVVDPAYIGIAGIRLRDAATGKLQNQGNPLPKEAITPIGFSPDGRFLAFQTGYEEVVLWDPEKDKIVFRTPRPPHRRSNERFQPSRLPTNFVFTPDGKGFIRRAGALQRWNLPSGKPVYEDTENWGPTEEVGRLLFSPNGRLLASSSRDETNRLWDIATARTIHSFPKGLSDHLAFTPDGRHLFSIPSGLGKTVLQTTDVAIGRPGRGFELADRREFGAASRDREIRVTEDGKKVMILTWKNGRRNDESVLTAWNIATGECLVHKRVPWGEDSLLTPDGQSVLTLDSMAQVVKLLAVDTAQPRWELQSKRNHDPQRLMFGSDLAMSSDGRLMAARVHFFNPASSRTEYEAIYLGDMANGRQLLKIAMEGPAIFDFSADNRLFAVAGSDAVQFWETATMRPIGSLQIQSEASKSPNRVCARSLAISPDGRILATGHADGTILLWDATLRGGSHGGSLAVAQREAFWKDLTSMDAGRAYAAVWRLADDPATISFLKERLKAVPSPSPDVLRSLLNDLESDQFAVREAAERKLRDLGERAGSALREALNAKPSLEKRRRIEGLLGMLDGYASLSGEPLRAIRAVQVLERMGTAEGRTLLEGLARGDESARMTRDAKAALDRLRR